MRDLEIEGEQESLYGKIVGQCDVCHNVVERNQTRPFLGLLLCNPCYWKIRSGLLSFDVGKLMIWLERNLDVRIEFINLGGKRVSNDKISL